LIKSIAILEPIEVGIKLFQDYDVSLSMVYEHFAVSMVQSFRFMGCLTTSETSYILDLLQDRLDFMYGDAIGLSFILDPVIFGDGMCPAHKLRAGDVLFESAAVGCVLTEENADEMSTQKEQLYIHYTNWLT
jgi:hypothetical protein